MKLITEIPVNIWDDFYDDMNVPAGQIQETDIYIENNEILDEKQKEYLSFINDYLKLVLPNVGLELVYDDPIINYPEIVGSEYESYFKAQWKINVHNLTHQRLESLIGDLNRAKLILDDLPVRFYSES